AEDLERQVAGRRFERKIEAQIEIAVRVEPIDALDVGHGCARSEVVLVRRRKGVAVPPIEVRASLLAELLDESVVEVVRPRPRRLGQLRLDRGDVEIARRTPVRAYDDVQSSQHRLGDARAEVDACPFERLLENPLDAPTDVSLVPLEWEKDETRQETPERVAP